MITQGLLDWLSVWIGGILDFLPPLPLEWAQALSGIASAGNAIGATVSNLGPLVPFVTIGTLITWWIAAVGFWAVMLVFRLVLWLVGR